MFEYLEEERPRIRIKGLCQVHLQRHRWAAFGVQPTTRQLHRSEVLVDLPSLDEGGLIGTHEAMHLWRQAHGKALRKQLAHGMNQAYGSIVLEPEWHVILLEQHHARVVEHQVEASGVELPERLEDLDDVWSDHVPAGLEERPCEPVGARSAIRRRFLHDVCNLVGGERHDQIRKVQPWQRQL